MKDPSKIGRWSFTSLEKRMDLRTSIPKESKKVKNNLLFLLVWISISFCERFRVWLGAQILEIWFIMLMEGLFVRVFQKLNYKQRISWIN